MDTILNFMDKLYGDSKALTIVYVVGAILLLVFIILLIISLKKPSKISQKSTKTEETEKKSEDESKTENSTDNKIEIDTESTKDLKETSEVVSDLPSITDTENTIEQALENAEKVEESKEEIIDESKLGVDIPNVDDFVDDVMKKTYEKNEQFSSVYVDNSTKLDTVLDNLNVDEDVKEAIIATKETIDSVDETPKEDIREENMEVSINKLDSLKQQLDEMKKDTTVSKDELKDKLASLSKVEEKNDKQQETMNPEDLLKKLNAMKEK